jgi:hypothetical protein
MTTLPVTSWGQTTDGWQVSVDALYVLTRGNDVHAGDVFTESFEERTTVTPTGPGTTISNTQFDYGVVYEPIVTRMRDKTGVLLTVSYRGRDWGAGLRGWQVTTDGATQGSETSPSAFDITGIRMWDHSSIPVVNRFTTSGYSPVTYYAENELRTRRVDGFVERRFVATDTMNLSFRAGAAHGRIENRRAEGHSESAAYRDVIGSNVLTGVNDITLDADSEAEGNLFGPMFGLAGDATYGRVRFEWVAAPAVLLGDVATSGEWVDIDDITEEEVEPGFRDSRTIRLEGVIPMEEDVRVAVPVLDLHARVSVSVTNGLRVGAGVLSSTWFGTPVAPAFSIPGAWTDVEGTGWRSETRDLTFFSYSVFASLGF